MSDPAGHQPEGVHLLRLSQFVLGLPPLLLLLPQPDLSKTNLPYEETPRTNGQREEHQRNADRQDLASPLPRELLDEVLSTRGPHPVEGFGIVGSQSDEPGPGDGCGRYLSSALADETQDLLDVLAEWSMCRIQVLNGRQHLPLRETKCQIEGVGEFRLGGSKPFAQFRKRAVVRIRTPDEEAVFDLLGEVVEAFPGAVRRFHGSRRTLPGIALGSRLRTLVQVERLPAEHQYRESGGDYQWSSPESPFTVRRRFLGLPHLVPPGAPDC